MVFMSSGRFARQSSADLKIMNVRAFISDGATLEECLYS
jgi:hypothetical protein